MKALQLILLVSFSASIYSQPKAKTEVLIQDLTMEECNKRTLPPFDLSHNRPRPYVEKTDLNSYEEAKRQFIKWESIYSNEFCENYNITDGDLSKRCLISALGSYGANDFNDVNTKFSARIYEFKCFKRKFCLMTDKEKSIYYNTFSTGVGVIPARCHSR